MSSGPLVRSVFGLGAAAAALLVSQAAHANPRPLPFTYGYQTLGEGEGEVEEYVDLAPVKATSTSTGNPVWYLAPQTQTEFEYGINERLELGLYVAFQPPPGPAYTQTAKLTEGTGFKERLRLRLAEQGEWPIDVALYGELVEYTDEFEIEAKILLEKRIGNLTLDANAWVEREWGWSGDENDWVLNPTAGATYQITPSFHVGAEYWMRAEYPDSAPAHRTFSLGPHSFLGPTAMVNFGKLWWSTGVYARIDDVNHHAAVGDNFGPVWVRTVVGLSF